MSETFLVTGASGCIGAWVVKNLVESGTSVVASDLSVDRTRPELLMSADQIESVAWATLDVTDGEAVTTLVADRGISHIVHLAGLQIPFCAAEPALGAAVNVVGTVNVFEAARRAAITGLVYASSLAVMGPPSDYEAPVPDDAVLNPGTLYGVYKQANEGTARVFWNDHKVGSVGLRPYVVYGVGRDQGMTADLAKAILAAAANEPFRIRFDGSLALQHADDVAKIFIAAARADHRGAAVCNLRNDVVTVADFVDRLTAAEPSAAITVAGDSPLPFPADLDDGGLRSIIGPVPHIELGRAIGDDLERYRLLLDQGRIDLAQLKV
ncbi:MAG: NAD-dependent epimerase/dehydratase family protein [Acidimicrobiales bacterium]